MPNHVSFVPSLQIIYNERGSNQQRFPAPLLATMARAIPEELAIAMLTLAVKELRLEQRKLFHGMSSVRWFYVVRCHIKSCLETMRRSRVRNVPLELGAASDLVERRKKELSGAYIRAIWAAKDVGNLTIAAKSDRMSCLLIAVHVLDGRLKARAITEAVSSLRTVVTRDLTEGR